MHNGDEMSHVCCCLKRWLGLAAGAAVYLFPCLLLPVSLLGCAVKPLQRRPLLIIFPL